jgi:hypothetical protein
MEGRTNMSTLSMLVIPACTASLLGIMEARAILIDGNGFSLGPKGKGLVAQSLGVAILISLAANFSWLWRHFQWYDSLLLLAALVVGARSMLTSQTLRFWPPLRPVVAIATAASATALWLTYP